MNSEFMKIALDCAKTVKGKTAPNPAVGAVVVREDKIVGRGATSPAGQNHAEINAIEQAGILCRGADLYVSLEPCSHYGRTPPCVDAIIKAGFKRVFVACLDPNPQVSGRGTEILRNAEIEIMTGILEKEALRLNEDFFWYINKKTPFVAAKLALTLDNKIADIYGKSQWITNEKSLDYTHYLRSIYTAIGVGKNTLSADNPQLTARRIEGAKNPVRIVFSSDENIGENTFFRQNAKENRSIIVLNSKEKYKKNADYPQVWATGESDYKKSFLSFLEIAGEEGIDSILLEGGSKLITTALETQSINRLFLFYAPKILGGGAEGLSLNNPLSIETPIKLREIETQNFDNDILISGLLK